MSSRDEHRVESQRNFGLRKGPWTNNPHSRPKHPKEEEGGSYFAGQACQNYSGPRNKEKVARRRSYTRAKLRRYSNVTPEGRWNCETAMAVEGRRE